MRKLKVTDRRRQQKCHKKKRKNVAPNSPGREFFRPYPSWEKEKEELDTQKIVFRSSVKCTTVHSIRKFQVIVVQWRQRNETKRVPHTIISIRKRHVFFSFAWIGLPSNKPWLGIIVKKIEKTKIHFYATFSSPSLSSNLKVLVATKQ